MACFGRPRWSEPCNEYLEKKELNLGKEFPSLERSLEGNAQVPTNTGVGFETTVFLSYAVQWLYLWLPVCFSLSREHGLFLAVVCSRGLNLALLCFPISADLQGEAPSWKSPARTQAEKNLSQRCLALKYVSDISLKLHKEQLKRDEFSPGSLDGRPSQCQIPSEPSKRNVDGFPPPPPTCKITRSSFWKAASRNSGKLFSFGGSGVAGKPSNIKLYSAHPL